MAHSRTVAKALSFIRGFLMRPNRVPLTGYVSLMAETRKENYSKDNVLLAYLKHDSVS